MEESGTFRQQTFCQDVQNGHFTNFDFPPLDEVDGVEYTYKSFISKYKSVQCEGPCQLLNSVIKLLLLSVINIVSYLIINLVSY